MLGNNKMIQVLYNSAKQIQLFEDTTKSKEQKQMKNDMNKCLSIK